MANYSWYSNTVNSDPDQRFKLDVAFENGMFSWSVRAEINDQYWDGSTRNSIFGLTVNIGGNNYYRGDIDWRNYNPNTVIYSGTTSLANCNVIDGNVRFIVTGNYWYGTWNAEYRCSIDQTIAITPPIVNWPTIPYTITKPYNTDTIVSGVSSLNFEMYAAPGTIDPDNPHTITNYKIFMDGVQVYSDSLNTATLSAPDAGTHTYYFIATESNGATGRSEDISIVTVGYTPASFISVSSKRWTASDNTGRESDEGKYGRMSAEYNSSRVGNDTLQTKCNVKVSSFEGEFVTSGGEVFTSSDILSTDMSWTVTYTLYDDFIGIDDGVIRGDTIPIGRRGVEIIFDTTDGYGIGIGMKAESGITSSAFPIRIANVDISGNIADSATISYEPIEVTPQITRSSGFTIKTSKLYVFGRVAHLFICFNASGTYNVGHNIFEGSISEPIPKTLVMGSGYWGSSNYTGMIDENGIIKIRLSGWAQTYEFSGEADISWTFLF